MSKNALGYKKPEQNKRVSGVASFKAGDTKVRVTFQDDDKEFANGSNTEKFALADLQKKLRSLEPNSEGDYFIVLSSDGDEIDSIGPVEALVKAKLVDFSRPDGDEQDPRPIEKPTNYNGKEGSYQYFLAFFKVIAGEFKGNKVGKFLHYKFVDNGDGQAVFLGDPSYAKATRLRELIEFCEKLGMVDEPIDWPEDGNILPVLLERGLAADKTVNLVIKNGYIDSIMSDKVSVSDDEEVDETPAPKKSAKKVNVDEDDEKVEKDFPKEKVTTKKPKKVVEKDEDDDEDL